jgi:hypothetical protein
MTDNRELTPKETTNAFTIISFQSKGFAHFINDDRVLFGNMGRQLLIDGIQSIGDFLVYFSVPLPKLCPPRIYCKGIARGVLFYQMF